MATYVNDLRLKEIATGDESGTWGTSTNTNLELIAEAFSFGTEAITTNADTHTTTIADGSTVPGRSIYLKYTGTLDSACTITIGPNTVSKLWFIENGTSGSQNINISQGSGANVTIPAGHVKAIYSDGAGSGAAMADAFTDLNLAGTTTIDVLSASGNATIGGTLGVTGIVTLTDDLIIGDGKTIGSASDVDAMTIASNGQVTFSQTLIGTALDISGDIDVDGTTNLDVVDIDGALTQDGGAVFNEDSADVDFRVESNGNANMLFVDGGNNRVGVGAAPSSPFSVSAADGTLANFTNASDADFQFKTASAVALLTPSTGTLAFGTSDTERMRINSSGLVSIGTTTTDRELKVQKSGDHSIIAVVSGTSSLAGMVMGDTDDDDIGHILYNNSNNSMSFRTNTSDKMTIASTGAIGMGTTPPTDTHTGWTQLFIGQKGSVISENATGVHGLDGTFVTDNMYVDSDTGAFAYIEANESSAYRQEAGIHQFFTQASGSAGAAVTLSEKMRIASDGKVGIGESAPANAKLEILQAGDHDAHSTHGIAIHSTGNTNFTSMYMGVEDGIDSAYIQSVALDGSFTSKSLLLNANGGKVGIGINAPSKTLQIESGSTADDGLFLSHSSGTVYAKLSVNNPGTDNDTLFGSVSNNGLRFVSNNFERMRLGASGEFMHNTTSASTSFTIQGNTTADVLTVLSGSTANANVGVAVFRDGGAEFCGQITCNGSTNSVSYTTSSDARLKNVLGEAKGLEIINKLNPVHFEWKKSGIKQDGLIAQEVEPILPNAVTYNEESDVYSMDYIKLVTPLIKAIQEQQEQIDALQSEIKTLKGE